MIRRNAQNGHIFVCTEKGYKCTLEHIKPERAIGKPIRHFKRSVPESWLEKGYVVEVKRTEVL